ncbi:ABC transporter ATP-binding protein [Hirschia litorea]|uniref:ABC transporter ATP-binding protein n=1 Tax=Hirschia litorea TaxID=1199156 RepID=A0ABW2INF1_9PROT
MSNQSNFIVVDDLSHTYSTQRKLTPKHALQNISFAIPKGASFGLLGPNGAGKSTLISLLTGMNKRQTGSILIDNEPADQAGKKLKSISAIAPQDLAFYPRLTVHENLLFFAGTYALKADLRKERIDFAIEVCDLDAHLTSRAETLSGGLKRRLNLAIALLNAPEILYLDEPTVGIDARSRQTILNAIQRMHANGCTIVYTSHYMEEVEALCDHVAIIDNGKLIANNTMSAFLEKAGRQSLKVTMAQALPSYAIDELAARRAKLLSPKEFIIEGLQSAPMTDVIKLLAEMGGDVEQAHYGKSKLEDVYLDILKQNEAQQ